MGRDLTLLPFDGDLPLQMTTEGHTWGGVSYAHTLLDVPRDPALFAALREEVQAQGQPVPQRFVGYRDTVPDGTYLGAWTYGDVYQDDSGDPLLTLPARVLAAVFRQHASALWTETTLPAIAAYLAALPPERRVALYWE